MQWACCVASRLWVLSRRRCCKRISHRCIVFVGRVQTKGTQSFGMRHNKTHVVCRRCGRTTFHVQKGVCSSCAYPAAGIRACKCNELAAVAVACRHRAQWLPRRRSCLPCRARVSRRASPASPSRLVLLNTNIRVSELGVCTLSVAAHASTAALRGWPSWVVVAAVRSVRLRFRRWMPACDGTATMSASTSCDVRAV